MVLGFSFFITAQLKLSKTWMPQAPDSLQSKGQCGRIPEADQICIRERGEREKLKNRKQMLLYLSPGESPHKTVDKFPIPEQEHGGNTPYRVL
jgi:hypothetical protein